MKKTARVFVVIAGSILVAAVSIAMMMALVTMFYTGNEAAWNDAVDDVTKMMALIPICLIIPAGYCITQFCQMVRMANKAEVVIGEVAEEYYEAKSKEAWGNIKYVFFM